jgi:DNA-binding NarL/FixJ family response regulator
MIVHRSKITTAFAQKGERKMIQVLIVDEREEVRRGLRMRLAIEPDMVIVGETGDAEQALTLAKALDPDVVVLDIARRNSDSMDIIQHLHEAVPAAALLVLTLSSDERTRAQAQESGAQAFIEKYAGAANLLHSIRRLAPHRYHLGSCITPHPLAT